MKMKTQWLLVGIVAVLLCWIGWRTQAQNSGKDLWEYRVVSAFESFTINMNELGAQGWELVTIHTEEKTVGTSTQRTNHFYFKRKK